MKRLLTSLLIGALAILVMIPITQAKELGGGSYTWKFTCDTTKLQARVDTTGYYPIINDTGSSGQLIFLSDVSRARSGVGGYFAIRYASFDSSAAGTFPDSTKDTIQVDILTGDIDGVPQKVVWTSGKKTGFSKWTESDSTTDYQWFLISPDSTLGSRLWFRMRTQVADTVGVKLAAGVYGGIHFRCTMKLFGTAD